MSASAIMPKIMYIHHGGGIGGAPVSLLKLAQALRQTELELVVAFTQDGPIVEYAKAWGIEAMVLPAKSALLHCEHSTINARKINSFFLHLIPSLISVRRAIREVRPDIVHLNTSALLTVALGVKMQKIPIVWHIREVIPVRSWIGRQLARIICMLSNRIIATSTTVAEPFEMCSEEKKALIPNAVDLDEFDLKVTAQRDKVRMQWDVDSEDFAVGIIGSVQEVKGHFVLLDAARRLREEGRDRIRFIVVAGGVGHGYAGTWKGRAKKLFISRCLP